MGYRAGVPDKARFQMIIYDAFRRGRSLVIAAQAAVAATPRAILLRNSVLILLGLASLAQLWLVVSSLDRGADLSDTGYYFASIRDHDHIAQQVTQFGVVWSLLPLPDNILLSRIAMLVLTILSGAAFTVLAARCVREPLRLSAAEQWLAGCIGAAASGVQYAIWLPDPSYNSMAAALSLLVLATALKAMSVPTADRVFGACFALAGFLGMALILTRQPTALLTAVIAVGILLTRRSQDISFWMRATTFVSVGAVLYAVASSSLVEPFSTTLARFLGGLERVEILNRPGSMVASASRMVSDIQGSLASPLSLSAMGGGILFGWGLSASSLSTRPRLAKAAAAGAVTLLALVLIGFFIDTGGLQRMSWGPLYARPGVEAVNWAARSQLNFYVTIFALMSVLGYAISMPAKPTRWHVIGLAVLPLLVQFALVFGTSSNWFARLSWHAGMPLISMTIITFAIDGRHAIRARVAGLLPWGAITIATAAITMMSMPYRLMLPLTEQSETVAIGQSQSTLRVDMETRNFFEAIGRARACLPDGERPLLLDMTGRLPIVSYHLGTRPPGVPWMISLAPGSQAYFDLTVRQLLESDLRSALFLRPVETERGYHDLELQRRGITLSSHDAIATAFAPYPGYEVEILMDDGRQCVPLFNGD